MSIIFDFKRKEPIGSVVFALSLDFKKMKERIIIGEETEIRLHLTYGNGNVYYDEIKPLGTLLFVWNLNEGSEWRVCITKLAIGYERLHTPLNPWNPWNDAAKERIFLEQKYRSGQPEQMYAALRLWNDYLLYYYKNHGKVHFIESTSRLTEAFVVYSGALWNTVPDTTWGKHPFDYENRLQLWFPSKDRPLEFAIGDKSLLPLITYYKNRVQERGLYFQNCKLCGNGFLAKSRHHELCSEKCINAQKAQNKREFDVRAKANGYDNQYKNACQNWRNKINKIKKTPGILPQQIAEIEASFALFKKEALARKKLVKDHKKSVGDFNTWLLMQDNIIIDLVEKTLWHNLL